MHVVGKAVPVLAVLPAVDNRLAAEQSGESLVAATNMFLKCERTFHSKFKQSWRLS